MPTHDHDPGAERATLPPVPLEAQRLEMPTIRRIRAVYEDVVCQSPELAALLGRSMRTPGTVAALAFQLVGREPQECVLAFLLNSKHRLMGFVEVSRGTLSASLIHPREVFAQACMDRAASLIVAHNHPSGDPEPSAEDLAVTQRLKDAGSVLGIPLLDHVIVGSSPELFVSLRERLNL